MAMQEQAIPVYLQPMNQQAPKSAGPLGRLARIQNGIAEKFLPGRLRVSKRPGTTALSSVIDAPDDGVLPGAPRWLAQFRGSLVGTFSAQPYVYSEVDTSWIGRQTSQGYPTIAWETLTRRPVFNLNTAASTPDAAAAGSNVMQVLRSEVGGVQTAYATTQDTNGVTVLVPTSTLITNSFRIKIVSDGAQFWIASQAGAMTSTSIQVVDQFGRVLATTSIAWGAARDNWDMRYAPALGQVVLATPIGGGTTDMRFMSYAAAVITTAVHTTPAADCTKGVAFLDNTAGTNVYISGADNAFGVRAFEISSAGALTHTFDVDSANTDYVGNITGYAEFNAATPSFVNVAYSVLQDNTAGNFAALNNQTRTIIAQRSGGTVTAPVTRSLALASRAYHDDQGNYFAVMYYQSTACVDSAASNYDSSFLSADPSFFVLALSPTLPGVSGQFELGDAAMFYGSRNSVDFNPWHLSSVATDSDGGQHIPLCYLGEQQIATKGTFGEFTAFIGVNDYVISQKAGRPVETADELLIPGLQATRFDGNAFTEDGIAIKPVFISQTPAAGGHLTTAEQYWVAAVYEWLDNQGNVIDSAVSEVIGPIALGAGNTQLTTEWSTLRVSRKTNVRISVYRTWSPTLSSTSGVLLNKVGEVLNDPSADTVSFVDGLADSDAQRGQSLYTQPLDVANARALVHFPAPAFSRGVTADGRIFVIGYDNAIWFSEQRIDGSGSPFNPILRVILPTTARATSLLAMDARMVVLCADGTVWTFPISNLPNNNLTSGSIPQPEQSPFTTGSTSASIMTPQGAIYAAAKGPWLMDRGLSSQYIGAPVQDEIVNNLQVIDINVDDVQRLYFTLGIAGQGGTSTTLFVYDLISQCWYVWNVPIAPVVATSWKGRYVFADVAGTMQLLDLAESSTFTDNGAAITSTYELAPLAFASVNGYESCWQVQFYGQYEGPHNLTIGLKYDESDAVTQAFTQPVLADPGVYRYEILPNQIDCQALGLVFSDDFTGITPGDSFALEAIGVLVGVESGLGRIVPTTRRIAP